MIFTGFHPNASKKDMRIVLSYLLFPWKWVSIVSGSHSDRVESALKKYFNISYTKTFDSGRTALQIALQALDIQKGDEVLIQGYTCMVVSNAVVWADATPVYVDIDESYNIDIEKLESRISKKTKVLVVQHTFGTPANLDELLRIAKKHNLKVIEDCAHSLGASYKNKLTGTFGDIGMFSFGTDKVISCIRGGALITSDEQLAARISSLHQKLPNPPWFKTVQYMKAVPIFLLGKALYDIHIGKILLALSKKFKLVGQIIYRSEMQGQQTPWYPAKLANALAEILCDQLHDLDTRNEHRRKIAQLYREELHSIAEFDLPAVNTNSIWLRFPLQIENPSKIFAYAKSHKILLGDWYNQTIAPHSCNLEKAQYTNGTCPTAEKKAQKTINLPTNKNITQKDAMYIVDVLKKYVSEQN